jgi:cold shock CspA family protein
MPSKRGIVFVALSTASHAARSTHGYRIVLMRTHGTLTRWDDARGFGFILPSQGGEEIFVHVSAFPRDDERPRLNELISFETDTGPNGKLRAVRVMRPGGHARARKTRNPNLAGRRNRPAGVSAVLLVIAAIGAYGYSRLSTHTTIHAPESTGVAAPVPTTNFKCDGRTMCSQMTSCAEATYFIRHCPNTKMDGNRDGEPCEMQWCN